MTFGEQNLHTTYKSMNDCGFKHLIPLLTAIKVRPRSIANKVIYKHTQCLVVHSRSFTGFEVSNEAKI